jgi:hypothetical protein
MRQARDEPTAVESDFSKKPDGHATETRTLDQTQEKREARTRSGEAKKKGDPQRGQIH